MIPATKQRLTILFTVGISLFCGLIFWVSYFYLHSSILQGIKDEIQTEGQEEFVDHLAATGLKGFEKLEEDEIFQVYTTEGRLITQSANSKFFEYPVNLTITDKLYGQEHLFEIVNFSHSRYLVMYFSLTKTQVGRIAVPILQLIKYEHNFLQLVLWSIPGILLLAYLISRVLVYFVMGPMTEAFRFQENFSSNVTHELHTPLASLKGNLEVSLRKERSPEEYREFIGLGLKEVDRIIHLLQDLYLLARSNLKTLTLEKESVRLTDLVEELETTLEARLAEKSLRLIKDWPTDILITCDSNLFSRAVANLLDNAVKYSVENSIIQLGAKKQGNRFIFTCSNQSRYLKNETSKSLLTPFYRGSNCSSFQESGKGLGLNIINYIALSHGGRLEINFGESAVFNAVLTLSQPKKQ